jgi:hypothetical protein
MRRDGICDISGIIERYAQSLPRHDPACQRLFEKYRTMAAATLAGADIYGLQDQPASFDKLRMR